MLHPNIQGNNVIYYRREDGQLGSFTSDNLEQDIEFIQSPKDLELELIHVLHNEYVKIPKDQRTVKFNEIVPKQNGAFLVPVK